MPNINASVTTTPISNSIGAEIGNPNNIFNQVLAGGPDGSTSGNTDNIIPTDIIVNTDYNLTDAATALDYEIWAASWSDTNPLALSVVSLIKVGDMNQYVGPASANTNDDHITVSNYNTFKSKLLSIPNGRRVLFPSFWLNDCPPDIRYSNLTKNNYYSQLSKDGCSTPDTDNPNLLSIWSDTNLNHAKTSFSNFLDKCKSDSITFNYISDDSESYTRFAVWGFAYPPEMPTSPEDIQAASLTSPLFVESIVNDTRFTSKVNSITNKTFSQQFYETYLELINLTNNTSRSILSHDPSWYVSAEPTANAALASFIPSTSPDVIPWRNSSDHSATRAWNGTLKNWSLSYYRNKLFNDTLTLKNFNSVHVSMFDSYPLTASEAKYVDDLNGGNWSDPTKDTPNCYAAPSFYGILGQLKDSAAYIINPTNDDEKYLFKKVNTDSPLPEGVFKYSDTTWLAFMNDMRLLRGILRSSDTIWDRLTPWIASPTMGHGTDSWQYAKNTQYWKELVFHLCLHGTRYFNYFTDLADTSLQLHDVLEEWRIESTNSRCRPTHIPLIPVQSSVIVSGGQLQKTGKFLWRITAKPSQSNVLRLYGSSIGRADIPETITLENNSRGAWLLTTSSVAPIYALDDANSNSGSQKIMLRGSPLPIAKDTYYTMRALYGGLTTHDFGSGMGISSDNKIVGAVNYLKAAGDIYSSYFLPSPIYYHDLVHNIDLNGQPVTYNVETVPASGSTPATVIPITSSINYPLESIYSSQILPQKWFKDEMAKSGEWGSALRPTRPWPNIPELDNQISPWVEATQLNGSKIKFSNPKFSASLPTDSLYSYDSSETQENSFWKRSVANGGRPDLAYNYDGQGTISLLSSANKPLTANGLVTSGKIVKAEPGALFKYSPYCFAPILASDGTADSISFYRFTELLERYKRQQEDLYSINHNTNVGPNIFTKDTSGMTDGDFENGMFKPRYFHIDIELELTNIIGIDPTYRLSANNYGNTYLTGKPIDATTFQRIVSYIKLLRKTVYYTKLSYGKQVKVFYYDAVNVPTYSGWDSSGWPGYLWDEWSEASGEITRCPNCTELQIPNWPYATEAQFIAAPVGDRLIWAKKAQEKLRDKVRKYFKAFSKMLLFVNPEGQDDVLDLRSELSELFPQINTSNFIITGLNHYKNPDFNSSLDILNNNSYEYYSTVTNGSENILPNDRELFNVAKASNVRQLVKMGKDAAHVGINNNQKYAQMFCKTLQGVCGTERNPSVYEYYNNDEKANAGYVKNWKNTGSSSCYVDLNAPYQEISDLPETDSSLPPYNNSLNLLRFVDSDIYGYVIERNQDEKSIDDWYPYYPFTGDFGLSKFGDIFEFDNLWSNEGFTWWTDGLAGTPFLGGAMGNKKDESAFVYDPSRQGFDPLQPWQQWSRSWLTRSGGSALDGLSSFYDIGGTQLVDTPGWERIQPSIINKYQWFDFKSNSVMGSNQQSIAAGYSGSTFIGQSKRKINTPRVSYTSSAGKASAIYDLILTNPTATAIESKNPNLVETNSSGIKIAKIREYFSNDLNGDGIVDVPADERLEFYSIDQSTDQVLATLDKQGSIRIAYCTDFSAAGSSSLGNSWESLVYFDKEWIGDGFLTDDFGNPVFIENRDFTSVTATGGVGTLPIYVWCLHKNGKLYGVELTSAVTRDESGRWKKKQKFVINGNSSSGRHPNFGTAGGVPSGSQLNSNYDQSKQLYTYINQVPVSIVPNGYCKEIAYFLNRIPKVNGVRFPVVSVYGGYHTGGVATCINPNYTGYLPTPADNFKHPVQMCEIVKFQDLDTSVSDTAKLLSKIQKYSASYDSVNKIWSYAINSKFDQEAYDGIFGVTITTANGNTELVYVPPRCVSIGRTLNDPEASPSSKGAGNISILSNNGTWTPLVGKNVVIPCRVDKTFNPNWFRELTVSEKLNVFGDFTSNDTQWNYAKYGESPLFNSDAGFDVGHFYKFSFGPSPNTFRTVSSGTPFNEAQMFTSYYGQASAPSGWGNPPRLQNGSLMPQYRIPVNGQNTDNSNARGFSFYDYFGNPNSTIDNLSTDADYPLPIWGLRENNYINNTHIIKVIAYKDANGNLPINPSTGLVNTNYTFEGSTIPILAIADHDKLDNPFAWIRSVGDIIYGIRFDGAIDIISKRTADLDGFIFDPWWGGCYPENRTYHLDSTKTWDQMRPADYNEKLNTLKKVGSYISGTYTTYNHDLPTVFSQQSTNQNPNHRAGERINNCTRSFIRNSYRKSFLRHAPRLSVTNDELYKLNLASDLNIGSEMLMIWTPEYYDAEGLNKPLCATENYTNLLRPCRQGETPTTPLNQTPRCRDIVNNPYPTVLHNITNNFKLRRNEWSSFGPANPNQYCFYNGEPGIGDTDTYSMTSLLLTRKWLRDLAIEYAAYDDLVAIPYEDYSNDSYWVGYYGRNARFDPFIKTPPTTIEDDTQWPYWQKSETGKRVEALGFILNARKEASLWKFYKNTEQTHARDWPQPAADFDVDRRPVAVMPIAISGGSSAERFLSYVGDNEGNANYYWKKDVGIAKIIEEYFDWNYDRGIRRFMLWVPCGYLQELGVGYTSCVTTAMQQPKFIRNPFDDVPIINPAESCWPTVNEIDGNPLDDPLFTGLKIPRQDNLESYLNSTDGFDPNGRLNEWLTQLGKWITDHPDADVGLYIGYAIPTTDGVPSIGDIAITGDFGNGSTGQNTTDGKGWQIPDPKNNESHREFLIRELQPWMNIGIKCLGFDAGSGMFNYKNGGTVSYGSNVASRQEVGNYKVWLMNKWPQLKTVIAEALPLDFRAQKLDEFNNPVATGGLPSRSYYSKDPSKEVCKGTLLQSVSGGNTYNNVYKDNCWNDGSTTVKKRERLRKLDGNGKDYRTTNNQTDLVYDKGAYGYCAYVAQVNGYLNSSDASSDDLSFSTSPNAIGGVDPNKMLCWYRNNTEIGAYVENYEIMSKTLRQKYRDNNVRFATGVSIFAPRYTNLWQLVPAWHDVGLATPTPAVTNIPAWDGRNNLRDSDFYNKVRNEIFIEIKDYVDRGYVYWTNVYKGSLQLVKDVHADVLRYVSGFELDTTPYSEDITTAPRFIKFDPPPPSPNKQENNFIQTESTDMGYTTIPDEDFSGREQEGGFGEEQLP